MSTFYCVECNHEGEEKLCPMCGDKTEPLEVKDDPLYGQRPGQFAYQMDGEDDL